MSKFVDKESIMHHMHMVVHYHKQIIKVDRALSDIGMNIDGIVDSSVFTELRNSYVELIWKMILEARDIEELCAEEFEFFDELFYDIAYKCRDGWTVEKMYDYFTNIENIIKDFKLGRDEDIIKDFVDTEETV